MSDKFDPIKKDLVELNSIDFYNKYFLRSHNWYFKNVLNIPNDNIACAYDDFKQIVSSSLDIQFNNILLVGSAKIGFSLNPKKKFKQFSFSDDEKPSDLDIAIISNRYFELFWKTFRSAYCLKNKHHYKYISRSIYRGYICEHNIRIILECRKRWQEISAKCNKKLQSEFYIKNPISYRIYRNWDDLQEYSLSSISDCVNNLKNKEINNAL